MFIFRGLVRATSNLCRSSFCYGWMFRCARINCDAETHTITRWSWRVYRLTVRNIDTRKDNGWPSSEYVESTTHWLCSQSTDVSTDWMTDSIAFAHVRKINIRLPVRNKCRDKAEKMRPQESLTKKKEKEKRYCSCIICCFCLFHHHNDIIALTRDYQTCADLLSCHSVCVNFVVHSE